MFPLQTALVMAVLLLAATHPAYGQVILYEQDFESSVPPALPPFWWSTSPQIFTDLPGIGTQSSGYAGASGGVNLAARNCLPLGELRQFQVDNISTLDASGLILRFGHRRTASFTPSVALEWSADEGNNWQALPYNSSTALPTWSLFTSPPLPQGTHNQASLSLRWTYITAGENTACHDFAGTYRIDDLILSAAVLPIELTGFTGLPVADGGVLLEWETASEKNNAYFAVERGTDGSAFGEVGRLPGASDSNEPRAYRFTDQHPPAGLAYYRLRQVDHDGRYSFSPVVAVETGKMQVLEIFPNPATDFLDVRFPNAPSGENTGWSIFDIRGRQVRSGCLLSENERDRLRVADLNPGVYWLQWHSSRASLEERFVKI
jgi:hypothetical protein